MRVTVYSTTTCPYCKMVKSYLTEKGIDFVEKLVDQDEESQKEMLGVSGGFMGVPFTVVEKEGEEKLTVIGFDKGKLDKIVTSY